MKNFKRKAGIMAMFILPLILLCSCYEIVYVSQDSDLQPDNMLRPDICVQVYVADNDPVTPYFGIQVHESWQVLNGIRFTQEFNGNPIPIGIINFDKELSDIMNHEDPLPNGYIWWVGKSKTQITSSGVFHVYPNIGVGGHYGNYSIDYMIGDSRNGLDVLRSGPIEFTLVNDKSPSHLTAFRDGKSVELKWNAPQYAHNLAGYYIYKNGMAVNDHLIKTTHYTDLSLKVGSYSYTVQPVYKGGSYGHISQPVNVCYSPCGTSMDFDGVDDKLVVFDDPSLEMHGGITVEAWIKLADGEPVFSSIISKGVKNAGYELQIARYKDMRVLEFILPFGHLQSKTPLLPDTWYHVAGSYNGKTMNLYINGKLDSSMLAYGMIGNSTYPLTIGRSSMDNINFFYGDIDNVRIWNVGRTPDQIFENFSSAVPPESEGLVGAWKMSEGCNIMTCDNSLKQNNAYLSGSCWCAEVYPYVESVSNQTNNSLIIPVMNYRKQIPANPPNWIDLEFKINTKLLKFEKLISENTQLEGYVFKTTVSPDGTIKIKAVNNLGGLGLGDVLIYVDVKPLQPKFTTQLKFNACTADGMSMRVESGTVDVGPCPENLKTGVHDVTAADRLLSIYPNPATTCLSVEIGELESPAELSIVNIAGKEVYHHSIQPGNSNTIHKIDLLGFSKGIYLINLQLNENVHVKKFAVN